MKTLTSATLSAFLSAMALSAMLFGGKADAASATTSMMAPAIGVSVTCGWDYNRDGKADVEIIAEIPAQRTARPNWRERCNRARLAVDDTFILSGVFDFDPTPGPIMHRWQHSWDQDMNGVNEAVMNFHLQAQHDPDKSMTARRAWNARKALDDTFTQAYPIP